VHVKEKMMKKILILLTLIINVALGGSFTLSQDQENHLDNTLLGMMNQEDTTLQGNREHAQKLLDEPQAFSGGWENSKFKYSYKMLITDTQKIAIFIILEVRKPNSKVAKMFAMQEGFILFGDAKRKVGEQLVWSGYLKDSKAPTITLNGSSSLSLSKGSTYIEKGATAIDEFDGELNVTITGEVDRFSTGTYTLTYSAIDSSGNEANVTRSVKVYSSYSPPRDTTPPTITITGNNPHNLYVGESYNDAGATTDEGSISHTGEVNTSKVGTYTITYWATDSAGNKASQTRTVNVLSKVPMLANTTLSVDENATNRTIIGKIKVLAEGNSSIQDFYPDTMSFYINPNGEVSLGRGVSLNYESDQSYRLRVTARNSAGTSNEINLTINVNNIIDEVPTLNTTILDIDEDAPVGSVVGSVTIHNSGDSPIINFELNDTTHFAIDADGNITTKSTFDYKTKSSYLLEVNATNTAGVSLNQRIDISINDTTPPTVTITDSQDGTATTTEPITFTFTWDEDVSGFASDDITIAGGSKGEFASTSASIYTLDIIPEDNSTDPITIDIIANNLQDSNSNYNAAITQYTQEVNTTKSPTIILPLKKTGQTKSYDSLGNEITDGSIKDDGYYQTGQAHSYTRDASKEIVTDHVTGLMWQDNAEANSTQKAWITSDTNGDTATTYCQNLTLGSYNDWRLPTLEELRSITDYGIEGRAISSVFLYLVRNDYWSSTHSSASSQNAWIANLKHGFQYDSQKTNHNYVRCVRVAKEPLEDLVVP